MHLNSLGNREATAATALSTCLSSSRMDLFSMVMLSDIPEQDNLIQTECKRCGTCCRKGGPCLHHEDRRLVVEGILKPSMLMTYRRGELAVNPDTRQLIRLESEMIKIRGKGLKSTCLFLNEEENVCLIYEKRPLECRILKCWDTEPVRNLFLKDLLTRIDLIPPGTILFNLVQKYEEAFPVEMIFEISQDIHAGHDSPADEPHMLADNDASFRAEIMKALGISADELLFFLGRPVSTLLEGFQEVKIGAKGEK